MIEIQLERLNLVRERLKAIPGAAEWAIYRLLNDVAPSGRDIATEEIIARYTANDRPVRHAMRIFGANPHKLSAIIRVSGSRFKAQTFNPEQTPEGVTIEEIRGQRSRPIHHVFMAVMKYGPSVFGRTGKARGPVRAITGLSVANMAREHSQVLPDLEKRIRERIEKRAEFWMGEALRPERAKQYGN